MDEADETALLHVFLQTDQAEGFFHVKLFSASANQKRQMLKRKDMQQEIGSIHSQFLHNRRVASYSLGNVSMCCHVSPVQRHNLRMEGDVQHAQSRSTIQV